ncbi:MAG TPA: hypothetical protein VF744_08760 [Beijerinckiaceae bacterium]|jgi:hypothetical protein
MPDIGAKLMDNLLIGTGAITAQGQKRIIHGADKDMIIILINVSGGPLGASFNDTDVAVTKDYTFTLLQGKDFLLTPGNQDYWSAAWVMFRLP